MAFLSLTMATTTTTFSSPMSSETAIPRRFKQTHPFRVSCKGTPDDHKKTPVTKNPPSPQIILPKTSLDMQNVDRRNLLVGIGGLYTTVNLTNPQPAFAVPIEAPSDLSGCHDSSSGISDAKNAVRTKACCPPASKKPVKDFIFPRGITRTRPAAHRASELYVKKFKAAIKAMRDLPDDHPHSFKQQAMIHCAYCNGGYTQVQSGYEDKELQIHNSWLFFPFHRWYLYFFERIMGKLINDPTFALPYWNWDNPAGMEIPQIFEDDGRSNPIFDGYRNAKHLPPTIVNLDYDGKDNDVSCLKQISNNLSVMYKQMIRNATDTKSFFGGEYVAGKDPIQMDDWSVGTIEAGCHTAIHRWVGDPRMPNREDLGNFYSAGYDPLFYVHHANVDRMWTIWKDLSMFHKEPTKRDWLDASYVFYDENEELVRVYNRDCVKIQNLKYKYEKSNTPWMNSRSNPVLKKSGIATRSVGKVKFIEDEKFPVKVDGIVKVLVKRPVTKRSKEDKEEAVEVLLINGIQFDGEKFVKFDVFVNDASNDGSNVSVSESEFAGSFAQLPHNHSNKMSMRSGARFGLTELLEDIEAEDDESILVTIVPREGCEDVTISEIKIELVDLA